MRREGPVEIPSGSKSESLGLPPPWSTPSFPHNSSHHIISCTLSIRLKVGRSWVSLNLLYGKGYAAHEESDLR